MLVFFLFYKLFCKLIENNIVWVTLTNKEVVFKEYKNKLNTHLMVKIEVRITDEVP